ncbi:sensor histidine kinase/response regulator [Aspergillus nomiae NRRL 13137]|uniref:Sensor histidine kinase/response regulator n=1 Tax=Aspergillus nomiae NRRL (strain ATCC 15546 / NRRL 13137 / CBS 260.88 / M93) TaxID=1509407 RepID=A0A0L1JI96_ASPN3|nr:sensor histidine kinase/response regulator [Aspergillus nomiae NRRL 13137]KNG91479.1 sensor histidine kinase/response regulator [Aspergillus nomiae NRRL 13137]
MHSILSRLYRPKSSIGTEGSQDQPAPSPTYLRKPSSDQNALEDTILTGLAELGAHRVGCRHAFVTLLDNNEPYVIAEAIISHTAGDDGSKRSSLLGLKTLGLQADRSYPANGFKEPLNGSCRIVLDIRSDHAIGGHPFVTRCPNIRFYAEIPLRSSSGDIFGTYCVADGGPRSLFADGEVSTLKEVAGSIVSHLENIWTLHKCQKSERLLDALREFSKGQSSGYTERNFHSSRVASGLVGPQSSELPDINRISLSTDTMHDRFGSERPKPQDRAHSPSFFKRSDVPIKVHSSAEEHQQHIRRCSDESSNLVTVSEGATSSGTSALLSYASVLLQESMKLDGVLFLDASRSNSRSYSSASVSDWDGLSKDSDTSAPPQSPALSSQGIWSEKQCDVLGHALSEQLPGSYSDSIRFGLTEGLLHEMFTAFPHGEVFYPQGPTRRFSVQSSSSRGHSRQGSDGGRSIHQGITVRLGFDFPESRSLIFLPLWNWDKSRWLAGAIMWVNDKQRALGPDDLCFLRAFGDSIVAKYSQLGWRATEKSKSDLLSSVSHELRSPLHGMLASAELLQTTRLEPAQRDMLTMVETCGLTLLDTMNYLLDFTKINNLTHLSKAGESVGSAYDNLTTDFDLGTLIEDVSETLYAGHRSLINAAKIAGRYLPSGAGVGGRSIGTEVKQLNNPDDLSVVVRIEEQKSWSIHSVSGGWRRIVMNLLGNSFKFTRSGLIEVTLSKEVEGVGDQKTTFAHLTINDTGCGISSEFLEHKLYLPFAQEDVLTEGCGLGLSIVQQLVTNLGGYIEVHSQVGVGTKVDVHVPIEYAVQTCSPSAPLKRGEGPGSRIMTRVCLVGLNPYTDLKGVRKGVISTEAKRKLSIRGALSNVLLSQPGWMVSFADSLEKGSGDIGVVEESSLKKIAEAGPIDTQFNTIIVLGEHGVSLPGNFAIKNADIIYLSQPLGPRKLTDALQRYIDAHREASPLSESPIAGPFSGFPGRGRSLSEAFAAAKGSESPPMVRENVAELSPFPTPQALNQKNIHVLIVDDNDIMATFMRKIGCSYETATNGLAALEKYKACAGRFDYVLMDISMPIMDGIVSSSKIREYEEQNSLPRSTIMAVTGVASSSMQQQAFAAGIDDYLVKPLSLHDLKRIMNVE